MAEKDTLAPGRRHVQLDFTPRAMERLKDLRREVPSATSNAEIVRRALLLFEWYLIKQEDGWTLQLVTKDTVQDVHLII